MSHGQAGGMGGNSMELGVCSSACLVLQNEQENEANWVQHIYCNSISIIVSTLTTLQHGNKNTNNNYN